MTEKPKPKTTEVALMKRQNTVFAEIEKVANLPARSLSLVGLSLTDPDMTYDDWTSIGRNLGHVGRWTSWALGDWLNFGESIYGQEAYNATEGSTPDRYNVASRVTGLAADTLKNYASICGRIATSRRRVELPFHTHEPVAALTGDEQKHWLHLAVENAWSKQELRDAIKESKNPTGDSDTGDDGSDAEPPPSVSERIESAARLVYNQAQNNTGGDWVVPASAMAQLAAALGEE